MAEGRGKAQAESLRKGRSQTRARKLSGNQEIVVFAPELKTGNIVVCEAGDVIPSDGEVIEGIASVDESAVTGESAPVIRESGGDRSAVRGGTKVISDRIIIRISCEPGNTFIDRMIALVENARRQKTPNEIALSILLTGLSVLFLLVVVTLPALYRYSLMESGMDTSKSLSIPVLVALLVCLIPTTIGGLLSAIGISGMNRLMQHNVMAASGSAIEAAGDIDVLLLDKTGTITLGNRMATDFIPADGVTPDELADAAQFSSLSDETPEGRSIVILAKERFNIRGRDVQNLRAGNLADEPRRRLYSEINIASIRLNRLIENLLNMSRLESGRTTPHPGWCDVHDLINKVAESLEQELHHFHLSIVIPEDMPLVYIDFGLIEQVLYNLLLNATQYAPAGSTIRAKFFYDNGFLTIQVMDRGPGFPESEIESIFYKFYRGKDAGTGGTGLGLSIVKGFVEAHQGTVIAENRKNGGALFTIKIPVKISDLNPDRIEEIT